MKIIYILFIVLICVVFAGCATANYGSFYISYVDSSSISAEYKLKDGEEPRIIPTDNIVDEFKALSNNYVCIGSTDFNAPKTNIEAVIKEQCLTNGARIAIYQVVYTHTVRGEPPPRYNRNNYGGRADAVGIISSINDLVDVIISSQKIDRYNYNVYYFVPSQL